MESSGIFSNTAMLGLEVQLPQPQSQQHHHQQQMSPPNHSHRLHPLNNQHSQIAIVPQTEVEPHGKQACASFSPMVRQQQQAAAGLSDEEDPNFGGEEGDPKRKISPWQRMKWTDNMVRLLINEVYYIGDEGGVPEAPADHLPWKKKPGGVMQKKGKWKSVSQAMMEKGFFVSPQQCEDKFNDLNKRYKRVNDILGKGVSCRVVENQSLLESMEQLPSKTKEEVRKLLNSKHLFFREMCAYHNSGGGGSTMVESSSSQQGHRQAENNNHVKNGRPLSEEDEEDEEDDEEEDEDDEEEDDEQTVQEEVEDRNGRGTKRGRREGGNMAAASSVRRQLVCEMNAMVQDGGRSAGEKRQWLRSRLVQLEEQRVGYEYEAFELEKQRLKWMKYSGKKERDMEYMKLRNERMKLENERMVLLVRQREMEMQDFPKKGELTTTAPPPA